MTTNLIMPTVPIKEKNEGAIERTACLFQLTQHLHWSKPVLGRAVLTRDNLGDGLRREVQKGSILRYPLNSWAVALLALMFNQCFLQSKTLWRGNWYFPAKNQEIPQPGFTKEGKLPVHKIKFSSAIFAVIKIDGEKRIFLKAITLLLLFLLS